MRFSITLNHWNWKTKSQWYQLCNIKNVKNWTLLWIVFFIYLWNNIYTTPAFLYADVGIEFFHYIDYYLFGNLIWEFVWKIQQYEWFPVFNIKKHRWIILMLSTIRYQILYEFKVLRLLYTFMMYLFGFKLFQVVQLLTYQPLFYSYLYKNLY